MLFQKNALWTMRTMCILKTLCALTELVGENSHKINGQHYLI